MMTDIHPMIKAAQAVLKDGVALSSRNDAVAETVAHRLLTLHATHLGERDMAVAYGPRWESIVGFLTLVSDLYTDELVALREFDTPHRLHLLRLSLAWMSALGTASIAHDVRVDLRTLHNGDHKVQLVLECAALAQLIEHEVAADTAIKPHDLLEMSEPIRGLLATRGVEL